jgi:hypothetical protein
MSFFVDYLFRIGIIRKKWVCNDLVDVGRHMIDIFDEDKILEPQLKK